MLDMNEVFKIIILTQAALGLNPITIRIPAFWPDVPGVYTTAPLSINYYGHIFPHDQGK